MEKLKYDRREIMNVLAQIKGKHPDAVVLFRGDGFYCTFGADALLVAWMFGLEHAVRNDLIEVQFSNEYIDRYLSKIVRSGLRVAFYESPTLLRQ